MTNTPHQDDPELVSSSNFFTTATFGRWLLIVIIAGLVVGVFAWYNSIAQTAEKPETTLPEYASSKICIQRHSPPCDVFEPPLVTEDDYNKFVQTQRELLRSSHIIRRVVTKPEIAALDVIKAQKHPAEWIGQRIDLTRLGKSRIFKISLCHDDAEVAAQIVNAVTDAYFNARSELESKHRHKMIEKAERERAAHEAKIAKLTSNLRELTREYDTAKDASEKNRLEMDLQHKKETLNKAKATLLLFPERIIRLHTRHAVLPRVFQRMKATGRPRALVHPELESRPSDVSDW